MSKESLVQLVLPDEAKDVRVAKPARQEDWKGEGELFVVVVVVVIPNHLSTLTVEDLCTMYVCTYSTKA